MAGKAEVKYSPDVILPQQIANRISDLGYNAVVIDNPSISGGRVEFIVSWIAKTFLETARRFGDCAFLLVLYALLHVTHIPIRHFASFVFGLGVDSMPIGNCCLFGLYLFHTFMCYCVVIHLQIFGTSYMTCIHKEMNESEDVPLIGGRATTDCVGRKKPAQPNVTVTDDLKLIRVSLIDTQ